MNKLKIVQIGIGHAHGADILATIMRNKELFDLVGYVPLDDERQEFAERINKFTNIHGLREYTLEEALAIPGLEAASIETQELNLTKYACIAANAGLHIFMDKPGATSLEEFEKLVCVLKEKKKAFNLGYMYRFNPFIMKAKEMIRNGELGEVYSIEAHMNGETGKEQRQWLKIFPGGQLFFLGCHLIDIIFDILGKPAEIIPCSTSSGEDGITADDIGFCVFKYPNKVAFAKSCCCEPGGYMRRQLVICGTKGTIELHPLEYFEGNPTLGVLKTKMRYVKAGGSWIEDGEYSSSDAYNRYDAMLKYFYDTAQGNVENKYTYDYELELYKTLLKACAAI